MKNKLASRTVLALTRPVGPLVFGLLPAFSAFSGPVWQDVGRWCRRELGTLRARCSSFRGAADNAWSYLSQLEPPRTGTASLRPEIGSFLFFLTLIASTFLL